MQRAFTRRFKPRVNVLKTPVGICLPGVAINLQAGVKEYVAIWDTGATGSVVTKKVADELDLKPIGVADVYHANGKSSANVYLINIILPDDIMVEGVRVTEGILTSSDNTQVLIGMDIIGIGDFVVTNFDQQTTMSFRWPSSTEIDFVPKAIEHNVMTAGNRSQRRAMLAMKRNGRS